VRTCSGKPDPAAFEPGHAQNLELRKPDASFCWHTHVGDDMICIQGLDINVLDDLIDRR